MDRAVNAWQRIDHERVSQHFVCCGFANNLDGTEDKALNENVQEIWFDLEMPSWRERLRRQIEGEVQAKRLTSMSQYKQVLVPYEDHRPAEEGEEVCEWKAGDVEKDAAVDTDDDAAAADEEDEEEGEAIVASGGAEADMVPSLQNLTTSHTKSMKKQSHLCKNCRAKRKRPRSARL